MHYYIVGDFKHIKTCWYGCKVTIITAVTSVGKTNHSISTEIPKDGLCWIYSDRS